ncbi:Holliday junction DNA helicase RuvB C-terminal domain-containing protein [Rubinisphaera brasiliensis]|uniref:Holliday junction DNA helicase RuvB domain protein n=1 Tax=Rubinisphaera brasiliensis (strain ATCC 49424 / DSM 5305 / JCM 21570 / IAM 15109 / NBRC 103401 / IFAM 1448) TaxID=756272 RepID=F0SKU8_RUBBR|nr:Holliday junction DNA helicase RuvB C-terminal domain-containing protein [Rubinisphaera brasiliensis]ADY58768.1 Holliday junction DNA helicase RuvB domain protein [Rubinisphaera brasiliensis DSM 5305]
MNESTAKDVQDIKPTSLRHLIGNDHVRQQVQVALDACFEDQVRFPDTLLTGPPGQGKSSLANVIAQELATTLHETLGQSVSGPAELNALLLGAKDGELIHIDEVHELPTEQQTALFICLDQRKLLVTNQKGALSIPLAKFSLLLSTTDPHKVLQPLRDRMRMVLELAYLTEAELADVVRQRSRALNWNIADGVPDEIAVRGRGTPRIALRILQSARRVSRSEGEHEVTFAHLRRACELDRIDGKGLSSQEQRYLELLGEGPTRLNVLASCLGVPSKTVSDVIEPFMIRTGLVVKDNGGRRTLTKAGMDHLSDLRTNDD